MASANSYKNGSAKASLSTSDIAADWPDDARVHDLVRVANRAFDIHHTTINNIQSVPDGERRRRMRQKLDAAAASGRGIGVSDLNEAFEHLAANNGQWRDDNVRSYFGGPTKCIDEMLIKGPSAAVNFLAAVDEGAGRGGPFRACADADCGSADQFAEMSPCRSSIVPSTKLW